MEASAVRRNERVRWIPPRARQHGYALLAVAIAAAAGGLYAAVERVDLSAARMRRASGAGAGMQAAKSALLGYAAGYRDFHATESFGYLPCPDADGSGIARAPCGKAGEIAVGLFPYKTLGLPDLRDAEGNCLWYAVSGTFKNNPKSLPFNWDTPGQIAVRSARGIVLAAPDDTAGGAAAVVVAPGPALAKQRRGAANACGADAGRVASYLEYDGAVFIDGVATGGDGAVIANDRVTWISPRELFDGIAKRSDFAAYLDDGIAALRSAFASRPAEAGNVLPAANPFTPQTSHHNFYAAWRDQFRFHRCAAPGCYAGDDGTGYDALLLFAGRNTGGAPRGTGSRGLSDYFESALNMALEVEFGACSAAPARFDNVSASADLALCVKP